MPRHKPAITDTTRKAKKGFTLQRAIRITRATKARKTINSDIDMMD
jgi:hypothetical protein